MRIKFLGLVVLLVGLFAACTNGAMPLPAASTSATKAGVAPLTPVKLGVGYIPNVQFAVFYVGIEKGFYTAEGLDVSLDYGFENDYLKLVGVDQSQFMVGSGDQVVLGRAQGLPVRYVMNWYSQYPVVIFAKSSAQITKPADLAGKKSAFQAHLGRRMWPSAAS